MFFLLYQANSVTAIPTHKIRHGSIPTPSAPTGVASPPSPGKMYNWIKNPQHKPHPSATKHNTPSQARRKPPYNNNSNNLPAKTKQKRRGKLIPARASCEGVYLIKHVNRLTCELYINSTKEALAIVSYDKRRKLPTPLLTPVLQKEIPLPPTACDEAKNALSRHNFVLLPLPTHPLARPTALCAQQGAYFPDIHAAFSGRFFDTHNPFPHTTVTRRDRRACSS